MDPTIRQVNPSDKVLLFEWRNDNRVRSSFLNSEPVTAEEHDAWFQELISGSKSICFIGLQGGTSVQSPIGYCRFDKVSVGKYQVSIMIAPDYQGRNLAHSLLVKSSIALQERTEGPIELQALVKKGNLPSLKLFERANFTYEHPLKDSTFRLLKVLR